MSQAPLKSFSSEKYTVEFIVEDEAEGLRLDTYILNKWQTVSRESIKKKIGKGEILVKGRPIPPRPSIRLHAGEQITAISYRSDNEDEIWEGRKLELDLNPEVVFEDENIIAINKPAFMCTHPTGRHLFYCATVLMEEKRKQTLHSLHRLDRETSGILLLGKNSQAARDVAYQFECKQVNKCYFLIAHKKKKNEFPLWARERMEQRLDDGKKIRMQEYPENSPEGKSAETHFHLLYENFEYIVALAFPRTGRTHQIRVHAMTNGFPLLGDKIYHGGIPMFKRFKDAIATDEDHQKMQIPRHALHNIAIQFHYFKNNRPITLISHIPKDLKIWMEKHLNVDPNELERQVHKKVEEEFKELADRLKPHQPHSSHLLAESYEDDDPFDEDSD